ncbi:MAG: DUF2312 domain-containing protein [Alphaproteobacteria bacterium]
MDSAAPNGASEHVTEAASPQHVGGVSSGQLKSIIERIERLEEEKAAIASDIKDIYAEAKANGFDAKILRQVIKIRKMDKHERDEQESLLDVYLAALGMA